MKTMGNTIKKMRDAKGWTQSELAKEAGTGEKYISALELGRRKPGPKLMKSLCSAFGVTEIEIRFGSRVRSTNGRQAKILRMLIREFIGMSETDQMKWIIKVREWKNKK